MNGLISISLIIFVRFHFDPVEGVYEPNMDLNDAEIKLEDMLHAPEAFAMRQNDSWIYTGIAGGSIVKFDPETYAVQLVAKSQDEGCGKLHWQLLLSSYE
jgi:hypothetical protein